MLFRSPFTHVIKGDDAAAAGATAENAVAEGLTPEAALAATASAAAEAPKKKLAVRIRKADAAPF